MLCIFLFFLIFFLRLSYRNKCIKKQIPLHFPQSSYEWDGCYSLGKLAAIPFPGAVGIPTKIFLMLSSLGASVKGAALKQPSSKEHILAH